MQLTDLFQWNYGFPVVQFCTPTIFLSYRSVTRSQPLSGMHICLQINNAMTMKWNALLSMAGCHSVSNLQKDAGKLTE